jgi:hypothetical protein
MLPQIFDPQQSRKLIQDTLAEFMADLGKFDQGEPQLVILSKPGLQLVMLGGGTRDTPKIDLPVPSADRPLTAAQAMQIVKHHQQNPVSAVPRVPEPQLPPIPIPPAPVIPPKPAQKAEPEPGAIEHFTYRGWQVQLQKAKEPGWWRYLVRNGAQGWQSSRAMSKSENVAEIKARIDATIAEAEKRLPAPPSPQSPEARAEGARGGGKYLCYQCEKKTHKPLDLYSGPELGYKLPEVYLCPTCRNTRRQQVTGGVLDRTRLQAQGGAQPASRPPTPSPAPQDARESQEEALLDSSEFGLPEIEADDPVFSADMF